MNTDPTDQKEPTPGRDARLEIPDVLKRPVPQPEMLKEYRKADEAARSGGQHIQTQQATGWAIAMNFVWTLAAAGILGWAIQKWLWPSAAPWPLLIGFLVGICVGMGRFIRDAIRANR